MTRIRLAGTVATLALTAAVLGPAAFADRPAPPNIAVTATAQEGAAAMNSPAPSTGGGRHRIARPSASGWFQFASDEPEQDERSLEEYAQDDQEPRAGEGRGGRDGERRGRRDRDWRDEGPRGRGEGPRAGMMHAFGGLCGPRGERIVEAMLSRLERITRPSEGQRAAFDKLKDAATRAGETARAGCPAERPMTLTGRLAAMEQRLEALLAAVKTVRPALEDYFSQLNEEQKARVYAAGPRPFRRGYGRDGGGQGHGEGWRERRREERGGRGGRRDRGEDGGRGGGEGGGRDYWRGQL